MSPIIPGSFLLQPRLAPRGSSSSSLSKESINPPLNSSRTSFNSLNTKSQESFKSAKSVLSNVPTTSDHQAPTQPSSAIQRVGSVASIAGSSRNSHNPTAESANSQMLIALEAPAVVKNKDARKYWHEFPTKSKVGILLRAIREDKAAKLSTDSGRRSDLQHDWNFVNEENNLIRSDVQEWRDPLDRWLQRWATMKLHDPSTSDIKRIVAELGLKVEIDVRGMSPKGSDHSVVSRPISVATEDDGQRSIEEGDAMLARSTQGKEHNLAQRFSLGSITSTGKDRQSGDTVKDAAPLNPLQLLVDHLASVRVHSANPNAGAFIHSKTFEQLEDNIRNASSSRRMTEAIDEYKSFWLSNGNEYDKSTFDEITKALKPVEEEVASKKREGRHLGDAPSQDSSKEDPARSLEDSTTKSLDGLHKSLENIISLFESRKSAKLSQDQRRVHDVKASAETSAPLPARLHPHGGGRRDEPLTFKELSVLPVDERNRRALKRKDLPVKPETRRKGVSFQDPLTSIEPGPEDRPIHLPQGATWLPIVDTSEQFATTRVPQRTTKTRGSSLDYNARAQIRENSSVLRQLWRPENPSRRRSRDRSHKRNTHNLLQRLIRNPEERNRSLNSKRSERLLPNRSQDVGSLDHDSFFERLQEAAKDVRGSMMENWSSYRESQSIATARRPRRPHSGRDWMAPLASPSRPRRSSPRSRTAQRGSPGGYIPRRERPRGKPSSVTRSRQRRAHNPYENGPEQEGSGRLERLRRRFGL